jgi:hypothetical protein
MRFYTAATNGHIVRPPGDTRAWKTMMDYDDRVKLRILPLEFSGSPTSSHLVASGRNRRSE